MLPASCAKQFLLRWEEGGGGLGCKTGSGPQPSAPGQSQAGATTGNPKIAIVREVMMCVSWTAVLGVQPSTSCLLLAPFLKLVDHYAVEVVLVDDVGERYPEAANQTANKKTDLRVRIVNLGL